MTRVLAGRYQLLTEIGRGAMGIVYEARHLRTLGRCALKLLRPEVSIDADTVQRFIQEARASSRIVSDHIVRVFDVDTDSESGCPFLVMEYLEGEDLRKAMRRLKIVAPSAAVKIVLQASLGLARAHRAGVVHRDIKPENLFLTCTDAGNLLVKILDFGVAKFRHPEPGDELTVTRNGVLLGTPLYMAPEHLRPRGETGPESDVWALGVVLWELLTGGPPFIANTLPALTSLINEQDAPNVRSRSPWIEPELADALKRALSRDPEQRFASAAEFGEALQQLCRTPELPGSALRSVEVGPMSASGRGEPLTDTAALTGSDSTGTAELPKQGLRRAPHRLYATMAGIAAAAVGLSIVHGLLGAQRAGADAAAESTAERGRLRIPAGASSTIISAALPERGNRAASTAQPTEPLDKTSPVRPVEPTRTASSPPRAASVRSKETARQLPAITGLAAPSSSPVITGLAAPSSSSVVSASRSVDPITGLLTRFKPTPRTHSATLAAEPKMMASQASEIDPSEPSRTVSAGVIARDPVPAN